MNENPEQTRLISDVWESKWKAVLGAQKDGLNWLFTMNLGGIAGILTYASAKSVSQAVVVALLAFSVGLLALVFFALRYYYGEEAMFELFRRDVAEFRAGKITWGDLIAQENARPNKYKACEYAAWVSVGAAIVGIIGSVVAIIL